MRNIKPLLLFDKAEAAQTMIRAFLYIVAYRRISQAVSYFFMIGIECYVMVPANVYIFILLEHYHFESSLTRCLSRSRYRYLCTFIRNVYKNYLMIF